MLSDFGTQALVCLDPWDSSVQSRFIENFPSEWAQGDGILYNSFERSFAKQYGAGLF